MVAVPAATAVTTPVEASIVAIDVLPDVHVPPVVVLASAAVEPAHATAVPVIEPSAVTTVTFAVRIQPVFAVKVIVAAPAAEPVTTPLEEPTAATDALLLVHAPVLPTEVSVVVVPTHAVV